jgi:transcriptional/translational regulatory protein YebC/TACO1
VPESVVTDTGKNTATEAADLSLKSSDFCSPSAFLAYKLMEKLIDIMEDDDDVQNIWHNWEE